MASGSFNITTSNQYVVGNLVWTESDIDVANNTSVITVWLYMSRTNTGYTTATSYGSYYVKVDDETFSEASSYANKITYNSNTLVLAKTKTVSHDSDGSKSLTISVWADGLQVFTISQQSTSITLDTIPRASTITAQNTGVIGKTPIQLKIDSKSDSFTHTLIYAFGTTSGTIATGVSGGTYSWTVPTSFYSSIPSATSGVGSVQVNTYSGSTQVGAESCLFYVNCDESLCKPTVNLSSAVDTNSTTVALTGDSSKVVRYKSNVKCTYSASANNSASLSSLSLNGTSVGTSSTSYTVNGASTNTFTLTAKDSRGYSSSSQKALTLISYVKLTCNVSFYRPKPTTGEIAVKYNGNYFNGSFGSASNSLTVKYKYRKKGTSTWSDEVVLSPTISGNTYTGEASLGTDFDYQSAYEFYFTYADKLDSYSTTYIVSKGMPVAYWDDEKFVVVNDLYFTNSNGDIVSLRDTLGV